MARRYNRIPRQIRTYNQDPSREAMFGNTSTDEAQREQEAHEARIEAGQRMMQEQWDNMTADEAEDFWSTWCS